MKKSIFTSIILSALILVPALNALSQTDEELKAKIEKINAELTKAMLANDHEASLKYYTEDAISMPSYQPMLKGKEAIKKSTEESAASGTKMTAFEVKVKKVISSGDLVVEIGKYNVTMEMAGVPEPINDHGKYVTVWEKQADGSLKIKVETWNTDTNPWAEEKKE